MNNEPLTYEELIRKKRCINLTKYYNLTKEEIDEIYKFLEENKKGVLNCNTSSIVLKAPNLNDTKVITTKLLVDTVDGLIVSNSRFKIIPHYTPSSSSGYSGGSSSNNNNNNNNN